MHLYQGQQRIFLWIVLLGAGVVFICVLGYVYLPRTGEAEIDVGPLSELSEDSFLPGAGGVDVDEPRRVEIPSLGIDASIERVGITASGKMAVPRSMHTVGWYRYGPIPGELGTAIFAGHVDNALGQDGVFAGLKKSKVGDEVRVVDGAGKKIIFRIEEVRTVPYTFTDTGQFFTPSSDTARLVLITCGGRWVQSAKTYSERVVVTAVLTNESP